MSEQVRYRVSELAHLCGVNPRTIDYYTTAGLLVPVARSPGGHRFYAAAAVGRLAAIKALQGQGLHLEEIRQHLDTAGDLTAVLARVTQLQAELRRLDEEIAALAPRLDAPPHDPVRRALQGALAGAATYAMTLTQDLVELLNRGLGGLA